MLSRPLESASDVQKSKKSSKELEINGIGLTKVDHLAILVPNLNKAIRMMSEGFGLAVESRKEYPDLGMSVAILRADNIKIELIEPTGPGPYWESRRNVATLNHIAIDEESIPTLQERFGETGLKVKDESKRRADGGYIVDVDPSTVMELRIQLIRR